MPSWRRLTKHIRRIKRRLEFAECAVAGNAMAQVEVLGPSASSGGGLVASQFRNRQFPLKRECPPRGRETSAVLRLVCALLTAIAAVASLGAQADTPAPRPRLAEAATLIQQGQFSKAAALLGDVVQADPSDVNALLMLGSALSLVPRRDEAVQVLLRAMELRPNEARVYASAGASLARLGEHDAALQVYQRAVSIDANLGDAHLNIALILAAREEFDRAEDHMARAIGLESGPRKRARLHFLNGKLLAEMGRLRQAKAEFDRSVALDPNNGEAHLASGVTRRRLLLDDEAYPLFQRAVELAPDNPSAHYQLALELNRRGDADKAADHLVRAHELRPADQSIVYNLTRALHKAGRSDEFREYRDLLAQMIESDDRARENELETARLHGEAVRLEDAGNYAEALDKYRAVLRIEPLRVVTRRNLALVLCRLGRWDEGIEELKAILRSDPDDAETNRTLAIVLDEARRSGAGVDSEPR